MCQQPPDPTFPDGWDFDPAFLADPRHLPPYVPRLDSPWFGGSRRAQAEDLTDLLRRDALAPGPRERLPHSTLLPHVYAVVEDAAAGCNRLHGPAQLVLPEELLNRHCLWVGPPGVGKTSQGILPLCASLLADTGRSLVVFDPKGDQFGLLRDLAVAAGRPARRVLRLNLTDPKGSIGWNPLPDALSRTEALAIAASLVHASENRTTAESPFWRNISTELVADVLLGLAADPSETRTLPRVLEVVNLPRPQLLAWLHGHGVHKFAAFLESNSQNAETCLQDTGMRLLSLFDLDLCAVLSADELDLGDLFRRPTVLVVEMSESRIDRLRPIFNLLVLRILEQAIAITDQRPDARLPLPVSLVIDEFGSAIGAIPRFPVLLNTLRSRRVSITAAVQSLSQIHALYGGDAGAVLAGFCSKVFFPNCEHDDAEFASRATGTMAVQLPPADGQPQWLVRRVFLPEEIARPRRHPVLDRPVTMLIADQLPVQCYLTPHFRQPRFRDPLQQQLRRRRRVRRKQPLVYVPAVPAATRFTETANLTLQQIGMRIGEVEARLDLPAASLPAQVAWTEQRVRHRRSPVVLLRIAEELAARGATIADWFEAHEGAGVHVPEVVLKYLDYLLVRRRHERTKSG
ncbi:MAG: type IV secretory system conjugative DNA transfer family protein [Planctomycetes bacterium]|nr:type IV secretory system conjugative DNA transfer family protein [Planctomycetota bacterium]